MRAGLLRRLFLRYRAKGDGRALAAVFDLTARELLTVAAHLAPDPAEAEDLVQLTFQRAMERSASFDPDQDLAPWLYGILWREAAAARRRRARRVEFGDGHEPLGGADPADELASRELPEAVRSALAGLPRVYREVVEPLLLEDRAPREIAAALGRAPGTVRVQIQRGLERLRRKLPRELAGFGALGAIRGLADVRAELLAKAGLASSGGALVTGGLIASTFIASGPVLWSLPLVAGVSALTLAVPELLESTPSTPGADGVAVSASPDPTDPVASEDPMPIPSLLALPLAVLASAPAQERREVAPIQSVAEKVARLDELVGELLVLSRAGGSDADAAWTGLLHNFELVGEEHQRRQKSERVSRVAIPSRLEAWKEAIGQIEDPVRREQALREVAAALASGVSAEQIAACRTLSASASVLFDKAPFRPLLLPLARHAQGELRVVALYALYNTVREPEDRALVLALADDASREVRDAGPHLVFLFHDGDLTGTAGNAVLRMLSDAGTERQRDMLAGLWGARVSPELEAFVLALSQKGEMKHDAMYYALSTFVPKSEAVVRRLIEYLLSPEPAYYDRALWGLGHGVTDDQAPLVAEAARVLFEARSDASLQAEALCLVSKYGRSDSEPFLQGVADDARRPTSVREAARNALAAVRAR